MVAPSSSVRCGPARLLFRSPSLSAFRSCSGLLLRSISERALQVGGVALLVAEFVATAYITWKRLRSIPLGRWRYPLFWIALVGGVTTLIALTPMVLADSGGVAGNIFALFGSALTPVLFVMYLRTCSPFAPPKLSTVVRAFGLGAFLATPIAVVFEIAFGSTLDAAIAEETCKAIALLLLFRRKDLGLNWRLDGIILGAAVGMGFALIEDLFYAAGGFGQGVSHGLATVWLRAITGAFGHGLWTGILGGAIWGTRESKTKFRAWLLVGVIFLFVVALHTIWDLSLLGPFVAGLIGLIFLVRAVQRALRPIREAFPGTTARAAGFWTTRD